MHYGLTVSERQQINWPKQLNYVEEKRSWWGVRTSNPGEAASRSLVGSTPTLFRHLTQVRDRRFLLLETDC